MLIFLFLDSFHVILECRDSEKSSSYIKFLRTLTDWVYQSCEYGQDYFHKELMQSIYLNVVNRTLFTYS